jgi:hypothetical protein
MTREQRARAYVDIAIHPNCRHLAGTVVQEGLSLTSDKDSVPEFYRAMAGAMYQVLNRFRLERSCVAPMLRR